MEGSIKNKKHPRQRKISERKKPTGNGQDDIFDKYSNLKNNVHINSHEQNIERENSPEIEIPNCSQFIEHEPSVIWGSPQGSPNNNEEQIVRVVDLITPPQPQRNSKKKPVTFKRPMRKLKPEAVSPSFLTKLLAFSEEYKDNEDSTAVAEKCVTENNRSSNDGFESKQSLSDSVNQEMLKKPELSLSSTPIRDDFDMLLADDDVIIKFTQQIEETIIETETNNFDESRSNAAIHHMSIKPKELHINELKKSNTNNVQTPKSVKFSNEKNSSILSEQSSIHKSKLRTPHSAKYFKSGVFLGFGSRKSPRTRKKLLETSVSGSPQEICNDSFESALQTFVDDDFSFLDYLVTNENSGNVDLSKKAKEKKHNSACAATSEQKANSKLKIQQNELRIMPLQQSKSIKYEQTISKSKAGHSKKLRDECPVALLPDKTITFEDDLVNESELVNVLDIVESQVAPSSPPLRCTPEEIQRKRIEAKQKLAKKKLSANKKSAVQTILKPKR